VLKIITGDIKNVRTPDNIPERNNKEIKDLAREIARNLQFS